MAIEASLPKPLIAPNSTSTPAAAAAARSSPILHRTARSRPEPAKQGFRRQESAIEPPNGKFPKQSAHPTAGTT